MYNLNDVDVSEFIKITSAGVSVVNFSQIRNTLVNRYKQIYGSDIDLSTGSADGIFISDLALIINNILQSVKTIYSNLDVNTASGVYLDALCRLSNVTRKRATRSNASIKIRNVGSVQYILEKNTPFVDKNGTEWIYTGDNLTLSANQIAYTVIQVECSLAGEIEAPVGSIYQTVDVTTLDVVQDMPANVGSNAESDSKLRARRTQSSGAAGVTVLESMVGALLNINGIDDVKIYNNNTSSTVSDQTQDGTSLAAHSIYVILRQQAGVNIADSMIGSTIYEKLTPGVHTNQSAVTSDRKSYTYTPEILGSKITYFNQVVNWRKATPSHEPISIIIKRNQFFSTEEFTSIASSIMKYLNELPIGYQLTQQDVILQAIYADPLFRGIATYQVISVDISDVDNSDTYFNYTTYSTSQNDDTFLITLE